MAHLDRGDGSEEFATNGRILVVDDCSTARELVKRALEADGATVILAESGEQGLELHASENPDCILLDYKLPSMSGLEFLGKLRGHEDALSIPVVMMTASRDAETAVEALKHGAHDFLVKGDVSAIEVRHAIANAIEKARLCEKLRARREGLDEFAHTAAHDIKAPLRVIAGTSAALKEALGSGDYERAESCADSITSSTARIIHLVESLLAFTRAGLPHSTLEDVDMRVAIDCALLDLKDSIAECDARIEIGPMPTVQGNEVALAQLFQNLVSNAIKYRGDDPARITITARLDEDAWCVSVEDNGIGIDSDHYQDIFEPLKRLHAFSEHEGSGIGLATCHQIVRQHGGRLWVESDPGTGSTFWFTIPTEDLGKPCAGPTP